MKWNFLLSLHEIREVTMVNSLKHGKQVKLQNKKMRREEKQKCGLEEEWV